MDPSLLNELGAAATSAIAGEAAGLLRSAPWSPDPRAAGADGCGALRTRELSPPASHAGAGVGHVQAIVRWRGTMPKGRPSHCAGPHGISGRKFCNATQMRLPTVCQHGRMCRCS